jgi:hypothetical protein
VVRPIVEELYWNGKDFVNKFTSPQRAIHMQIYQAFHYQFMNFAVSRWKFRLLWNDVDAVGLSY